MNMNKNQKYTALLKEQIATIKKENRYLEFKSNYQTPERIGKYISALSNGACLDHQDFGYLYFGVEDETLVIKGTTFDPSMKAEGNQYLEMYLRQMISPKISFNVEEFFFEGKTRIVVFVIPAAVKEPTCFMKKPYVRVDSSLTELTPYVEWMREIYNSDVDWSAQIIENATHEFLDPEAIKKAREGYKQRNPEKADDCDRWSDEVFLDKAKLTLNGKITRTTLLLAGKEEYSAYIGHIAQIVWKCHQDGKTFGDVFTIPFLLNTTKVMQCIRNYRFKIFPDNSLIPAEVWKYDTNSILECLHNCIAHQNYLSNSRIVLTEEPDFLTFENAGGFYEGSYEDYILGTKTPEHYRNRFLAQAMVNVKMIDTQGYGIHTMYEKQKERFLPMPDYDDSTPNKVVLRLPGSVINEDYSKILIDNMDMDLTTTVLLDKVQKCKVASLSDNAIQLLRSKKYIEGRMPNIYVSKRVAQAADQKVEYSKHKGLEYKKCKVLLLDALEDHKRLSREEIDKLWWNLLSDVLTDKQKKTKVGNMLTKMKEERLIVNKTVGNISYWSLLEP